MFSYNNILQKDMQQTIKEFDSIKNENQIQIDNLTMLCSSKSEENKQ